MMMRVRSGAGYGVGRQRVATLTPKRSERRGRGRGPTQVVYAGLSFNKFGRILKEKAKADLKRVFEGTEKTRERLGVVDELLAYWKVEESEDVSEKKKKKKIFLFLCV